MLTKEIREAIKNDSLLEYKEEFLRKYNGESNEES